MNYNYCPKAHAEEVKKMCEKWNWNAHPTEIAYEIRDRDDIEYIIEEIREFFNDGAAYDVEVALAGLAEGVLDYV